MYVYQEGQGEGKVGGGARGMGKGTWWGGARGKLPGETRGRKPSGKVKEKETGGMGNGKGN